MKRDLLSVTDLTPDAAAELLEQALIMKKGGMRCLLPWRSVALLFEKPSLRTRVSFDLAVTHLGGHPVYLSPQEVGLGQREPVADVARVLGRYVDCIVARVNRHETLEELSAHAPVSVINALSDKEHPCQALADLLTIREVIGTLKGTKLAYVGDGNNVARSLALLCAMMGVDFSIASPEGYRLDTGTLEQAASMAARSGSRFHTGTDPVEAVTGAGIVYTDTWTSMGQETEAEERRQRFADYQVNASLLRHADSQAKFMHCLPAHHGEEVTTEILNGASSIIFEQAENRLHAQKALLAQILIPAD